MEVAHIRAVRDLLMKKYNWEFASAEYILRFPSRFYTVTKIDDADEIVRTNGPTGDFQARFVSQGGRSLTMDTGGTGPISIALNSLSDAPEPILNAVETACQLEAYGDSLGGPASSAFIAHIFDDASHALANELARFLTLIGIRCTSGRAFSPARVSDKVNKRLASHDLFFAIITPHEDYTWLTQEISTAAALSKPLFILKREDVDLKAGMLGDHEFIPFETGCFSKTFIPILEGIGEICGHESAMLQTRQEAK